MLKYELFAYIILILFTQATFSQQKIKIRASGSCTSAELSVKETKFKAVEDAKENALRKAGISENITFTSILRTCQTGNNLKQIFDEFLSSEIHGEVMLDTIISEKLKIINSRNFIYEVEIEATVYRYESTKDPEFTYKIEGINASYSVNDYLKFSFTPNKDGYLKIFNVTDDSIVSILYPNINNQIPYLSDVEGVKFIKYHKVKFPMHPAYEKGYSLKLGVGKSDEMNYLLFVFTKKNIPFNEKVSLHNVLKWIYSMSPDEREISYFELIIKQI